MAKRSHPACADVMEFLAELGEPRAARHSVSVRAVYQDACHLLHGQGVQNEPREVLAQIPGLDVIEIEDAGMCCGSGGVYNVLQPTPGLELGLRKANSIDKVMPEIVLSPNPGCRIQLEAAARGTGVLLESSTSHRGGRRQHPWKTCPLARVLSRPVHRPTVGHVPGARIRERQTRAHEELAVIRSPTIQQLRGISAELGLELADDLLTEIQASFAGSIASYERIDRLEEPSLPVRYLRSDIRRPERDENPLNAWYWRCSIPGAPSGLLAGKTVAVKDNICVAGVPMMNGSSVLGGTSPSSTLPW